MNNLKIKKLLFALMRMTKVVFVCAAGVFVFSCTKDWDDHYNPDPAMVSDKTLMDLISADPSLSTFAELLKQTKYDVLLTQDQAYTVWAPTNDALRDVNLSDPLEVKNTVENHLARFNYNASGAIDERVYMVDKKFHRFVYDGGSYKLNESVLQDMNIKAKNGILHTLNTKVPFVSNLWQYMNFTPGFEKIRDYLYSYTKEVFSPGSSLVIDINEEGLSVYDSVFYTSNELWNASRYARGIGFLDREDSIYTMLLPTNKAWDEAYVLAEPFFISNNPDPEMADSTQKTNTQYALIENLVFREKLTNFASYDSLVSTRRTVFHDPAAVFAGGILKEASNGFIYEMDKLNFNPWDAWHKEIRVEAESGSGREVDTKIASLSTRFMSKTEYPQISEQGYLEINAMNAGARPWIEFEIPNTLAGAYNIYCVFVPSVYYNPYQKVADRTRVRATFYELRGADWVTIVSDGEPGGAVTPPENRTEEYEMTKMLLYENFVFKYANYNELVNTIKVRIACSITTSEYSNGWTNNMKIDCILLEPVIPSTDDEFTTED
jgi:uncharacterized surface protein with fasciclin (FAS1) repeats